MIDRRAFMGSVLSLPLLGYIKPTKPKPIIIHYIFCSPTVAGHWLSFREWRPYEASPPSRRKGFERISMGYINREFAGYFNENGTFMVDEPLWGQLLLRERWTEKRLCKDQSCRCHCHERHSTYDYECRIVGRTSDTQTAPKIGWKRFCKEGYDKIWPAKFVTCDHCEHPAQSFSHTSATRRSGFYCNKHGNENVIYFNGMQP